MFKTKPMCEECGTNEATSFSFIGNNPESFEGNWKFVCECTIDNEDYYIPINSFFANPPAAVDWMAHMQEKSWMDWNNFMEMMNRFRKATNSFGAL